MGNLIHLEDVLFVFNAWTLMLNSGDCRGLEAGTNVDLFNSRMEKVGTARLKKYLLGSRNPEISAIEIEVISVETDMKEVKFIKVN